MGGDSTLTGSVGEPDSFVEALVRLGTLARQEGITSELGAILFDAPDLPGELGFLARRVRASSVGKDGRWRLGTAPPRKIGYTQSKVEDLAKKLVEILAASPDPLTTTQLRERLSTAEPELYVARALFAHDRVAISAGGAWHLIGSDHSAPHADGVTVRPDAAPAQSDAVVTQDDEVAKRQEAHDPSSREEGGGTVGGRAAWLKDLRERALAALRTADDAPLDTAEIVSRIGRKVRLKTMRQELREDARFVYKGNDSWAARTGGETDRRPGRSSPLGMPTRAEVHDSLSEAAAVLTEVGHPLTARALMERLPHRPQLSALRQRLDTDPRFHLTERDMWALTEWGMPVYKPIKDLVADMVDENGGRVPSYEVVKKLTRDFGVKEASVKAAMSSAPFTAQGGIVRRLEEYRDTDAPKRLADESDTHADKAASISEIIGLLEL